MTLGFYQSSQQKSLMPSYHIILVLLTIQYRHFYALINISDSIFVTEVGPVKHQVNNTD